MAKRTRARDAIEFAGAILLEWVAAALPERAALSLAGSLGRLLLARKRYAERAAEHLKLAFPDWSDARIRRTILASFENQARVPMEAFRHARRLKNPDVFRREVRLDADPAAWEAAASGKGVIFVTAHLGNWELSPSIVTHAGIPLASVGRPQENGWIYDRIARLRARLGQRMIPKKGALLVLMRTLKRGGNLALVVDQDARKEGIFIPFFGRLCSTYDSAAALALRTRRPIISGFLVRHPEGGFTGRLDPPIPMEDLTRDDSENRRILTTRMNERIEAAIRRNPEQWIWNYRRWKTRPPGEVPAEPVPGAR